MCTDHHVPRDADGPSHELLRGLATQIKVLAAILAVSPSTAEIPIMMTVLGHATARARPFLVAREPRVSVLLDQAQHLIRLIGYYCGGYVAGRMARFNGVKQGIAVWVWSIGIAIVVAILAAVGGRRFTILARLNGLPRLPINEGTLTVVGIITALVALAAALVGAILGGLAGMRYQRKIDRIGSER